MSVEETQKRIKEKLKCNNLYRIKDEIYDRLKPASLLSEYKVLKDVSPMQIIDSSYKIYGKSYDEYNTLVYHKCDPVYSPMGFTNTNPHDHLIGIYFEDADTYYSSITVEDKKIKTILCDYGTPYILRIGVWEGKIFTQLSTGGLGSRGIGKGIGSQYKIYIPEDIDGPITDAMLFRIGKLADEIYYEIQSLLMQINK